MNANYRTYLRPLALCAAISIGVAAGIGGYAADGNLLLSGGKGQPAGVLVSDSVVPQEATERLAAQAAAMNRFYVEFKKSEVDGDLVDYGGPTTYVIYCEGTRFSIRYRRLTLRKGRSIPHDHETSYDGRVVYACDLEEGTRVPAVVVKYLVGDDSDPDRTKRRWECEYLDVLGFFAPERLSELEQFSGVEPLVLHYLKESTSTRVERVGDTLRVTVRVPDNILVAAREMDLAQYEKYLNTRQRSPAASSNELAEIGRLRGITPERTVSFVLDAKRGYGATQREEMTGAGQLMLRTYSEGWTYYKDAGIWLPRRCVALHYMRPFMYKDFSDQPVVTNTFEVRHLDFSVHPDIPFSPDYRTPGTMILDRTVVESRSRPDHQVGYTIGADGETLRGAALVAKGKMVSGKHLLLFSMVLVLCGLPPVVYLFSNRRRRAKGGT